MQHGTTSEVNLNKGNYRKFSPGKRTAPHGEEEKSVKWKNVKGIKSAGGKTMRERRKAVHEKHLQTQTCG